MLDGIQDNANYPSDFHIDLIFSDCKQTEEDKTATTKNTLWTAISTNCAEKLKLIQEDNEDIEEKKETQKLIEETKKAFVIDSPGAAQPEGKVQNTIKPKEDISAFKLEDEEEETKKVEVKKKKR